MGAETAVVTPKKEYTRSDDLMALVGKDVRAGKSNVHYLLKTYRTHPHAQAQSDPDRAVLRCREKALKDLEVEILEMNKCHAIVWVGSDAVVLWPHKLENGLPRLC
ncbi:MAG: hypothetical protein L0Z53_02710, partial [Acidobacteriales bacterium]|nr:hypothetical protein [Terriglobales bacterium]